MVLCNLNKIGITNEQKYVEYKTFEKAAEARPFVSITDLSYSIQFYPHFPGPSGSIIS